MSQTAPRSLITCFDAYSKSLKSCYASLQAGNPTLECIKDHVTALIGEYVCSRLEDPSPFRILSVGSGDGKNDLAFLEILRELGRGKDNKVHIFERAIEPDEQMLGMFLAKAEHLRESLEGSVSIEFEFDFRPTTYQEYAVQKTKTDVKFDLVHFFHSLYYADLEALEQCYEKELGTKGVILCIIQSEGSAVAKYGREFSPLGLILNPGAFYSNRQVKDVAEKNGWKYVECSGESKTCDITAIFDASSEEGNRLLDFVTHWADVRATASGNDLRKILKFWENESVGDGHGKKEVTMRMGAIVIFKGM